MKCKCASWLLERKLKFGEFFFERKDSVIQVANKLYLGEFIYRKITIIEGSFKYDLISKLNFIDPDTKITIEDIPDEIVANTYNYHTTDDAERILENIIKLSNGYVAFPGWRIPKMPKFKQSRKALN